MQKALFTSNKDDWRTPKWLFEQLDTEFHFNVDLCADHENHLCATYYTAKNDGLYADIKGARVFCNPPYGRTSTARWIKKCAEGGAEVAVMLIPARTDTAAFHDYIYGKAEVRFLRGRLRFSNSSNGAPFPSMIVIFKSITERE